MTSAFLFLAAALAGGPEETSLDPLAPYSAERSKPCTTEFEFALIVTPPAKTKKLAVWLPIPPSDSAQEVSNRRLETFPLETTPEINTEPVFGNRFAYFEFVEPQGAQIIRHRFSVKTWELRWNLDARRMAPVKSWPAAFQPYLRGETQAVVVDDRFRGLLAEAAPQRGNALGEFASVMRWVDDNFTYDHAQASLSADAVHALRQRRGHCSDYHGFCASLGRALGHPTRITYGLATFPKSSPSHCKLEAFLPSYGWVSFDVSETQKLRQAIQASDKLAPADKERLRAAAQRRLMAGFRDNTWVLQTRGSDYELAPKASRRVPVVRTAWIEADGQPLPDPDPADPNERAFAWMTAVRARSDAAAPYPFSDWKSLEGEVER